MHVNEYSLHMHLHIIIIVCNDYPDITYMYCLLYMFLQAIYVWLVVASALLLFVLSAAYFV